MKRGFAFLIGLTAVAALGFAVMLLWNWLLPAILGVTAINFWQALGIFALSKILFGCFGFGKRAGFLRERHKHKMHNAIYNKWNKMSEDERKEFLKHRRFFFNSNDETDHHQSK